MAFPRAQAEIVPGTGPPVFFGDFASQAKDGGGAEGLNLKSFFASMIQNETISRTKGTVASPLQFLITILDFPNYGNRTTAVRVFEMHAAKPSQLASAVSTVTILRRAIRTTHVTT